GTQGRKTANCSRKVACQYRFFTPHEKSVEGTRRFTIEFQRCTQETNALQCRLALPRGARQQRTIVRAQNLRKRIPRRKRARNDCSIDSRRLVTTHRSSGRV